MRFGIDSVAARLPRPVRIGVVVILGVTIGLGGAAVIGAVSRPEQPASVARLDLPGSPEVAAGATPVTGTGTGQAALATILDKAPKPGTATAAVAAHLEAQAAGRFEAGWALLDAESREEHPSAEVWAAVQADRLQPVTFQLGTERPGPGGSVDVLVTATHTAAVDAFTGLTPGRTEQVWRATREGGSWRVAAEPVSLEPVLPSDRLAPAAVQAWLAKLLACDQAGAAELEAGAGRYGPIDLAGEPCERRGRWTVDGAVGFDQAPDPAYVAAFGPEVADWARLVPVNGPDVTFYAVTAPVGDAWRVLGTTVGPTG